MLPVMTSVPRRESPILQARAPLLLPSGMSAAPGDGGSGVFVLCTPVGLAQVPSLVPASLPRQLSLLEVEALRLTHRYVPCLGTVPDRPREPAKCC